MNIEEEIFKKHKIKFNKLISYGFNKKANIYKYTKNILDDTFMIEVEINLKEEVTGKVYDLSFNEEYINYRIENQVGEFSSEILKEFKDILIDIRNKCSVSEYFLTKQANRISNYIKIKYGTEPEFMWEKSPNYAVFRNKNNKKWYGIIMNLNKHKLDNKTNSEIEIINVKLTKLEIEVLLNKSGFYKAWHMNKDNWITIILDETLTDDEIINYIDKSYKYTN